MGLRVSWEMASTAELLLGYVSWVVIAVLLFSVMVVPSVGWAYVGMSGKERLSLIHIKVDGKAKAWHSPVAEQGDRQAGHVLARSLEDPQGHNKAQARRTAACQGRKHRLELIAPYIESFDA
jgi:hypothetical protein